MVLVNHDSCKLHWLPLNEIINEMIITRVYNSYKLLLQPLAFLLAWQPTYFPPTQGGNAEGNYHNEMSLPENCLEIAVYRGSTYNGQQGLGLTTSHGQSASLTTTPNKVLPRKL